MRFLALFGTVLYSTGLCMATNLDKAVRFRVIEHKGSFYRAVSHCSRHGYSIAPFHERVIPLILHTLADAKVSTVWGTGSSLAPGVVIHKENPNVHDLTVTFVNKRSPLLNQRHAVLCVKRRERSSHRHTKKDSSIHHSETSSQSSLSSQLQSSHSSVNKDRQHNHRRHNHHHRGDRNSKTAENKDMVIVNEQKHPRFKVRVDGVQVDPTSERVQKLIQQLSHVPLNQMQAAFPTTSRGAGNHKLGPINLGDATRLLESKRLEDDWGSASYSNTHEGPRTTKSSHRHRSQHWY